MKKAVETQTREDACFGTLKVCLCYEVATPGKDTWAWRTGAKVQIWSDRGGECDPEPVKMAPLDLGTCQEWKLPAGNYWVQPPSPMVGQSWQAEPEALQVAEFDGGRQRFSYRVKAGECTEVRFCVPRSGFGQRLEVWDKGCEPVECTNLVSGRDAAYRVDCPRLLQPRTLRVYFNEQLVAEQPGSATGSTRIPIDTDGLATGPVATRFEAELEDGSKLHGGMDGYVRRDVQNIAGAVRTINSNSRTETPFTEDVALWTAILNSTESLSCNSYLQFMDWIFCGGELPPPGFERDRAPRKLEAYRDLKNRRFLPFTDADAYRVVKAATEAFVMVNCGVQQSPLPLDSSRFHPNRDDAYLQRRDLPLPAKGLGDAFDRYLVPVNGDRTLPYLALIRRKLPDIPIKRTAFENADPGDEIIDQCFGLLQEKLTNPCMLELIWSYWHEEGMLVQTINAIARRFQNVRSPQGRDPLANLEIDPLRPLNNILWGYIQDEQHRLSLMRRNAEYDHHYGLRLEGKAVRNLPVADSRSKFLEAFHHLLHVCTVFFRQDDDTTVKADAFPVLNALKEVHLVLSQGAHNQFGDLPSTARVEMLMQEWLLARPEFREFLPTRIMVAYPEPWMDRVDAMKKLQGWTDTSVLHFRNLGVFGEQLLLSIRWGHWSAVYEPIQAFNWARFFRPQIQGYIHAYRAATGVDLTADPTVDAGVDATLPAVLLKKRLDLQQQRAG